MTASLLMHTALARAVVHCDLESLHAEVEFERTINGEWTPTSGHEIDMAMRRVRERERTS